MRFLLLIGFVALLTSCNQKKEVKVETDQNMMVKQSEMAALMLKMFDENAKNKQLVLKGDFPKDYPQEFIKLHTAVLTDENDRDVAFKGYSDFYLMQQKILYNLTDKDSLIPQHNQVINSCISCHQVKCPGPIPRIQKLLIK
ncbi:MAG: hypothetical protein CMB99_04260 [Flavobacteriaceae bacterium]|nr:hypothetical protein [Flavobacteriaceae bacterium]|tara:strand:- start:87297 stop:87722 length:426 start_codon:yes stop_codon:yes gene_type:complete